MKPTGGSAGGARRSLPHLMFFRAMTPSAGPMVLEMPTLQYFRDGAAADLSPPVTRR